MNDNNSKFGPPHTPPTYADTNPKHPDVEHQPAAAPTYAGGTPSMTPNYLVAEPPPRKSPLDCIQIVNLGLRVSFMIFSFIGFMLIVTIENFDEIDAYSYQAAMSALSFIYAAFQVAMTVIHLVSGKNLIPEKISGAMDFIIDQLLAYLLMSASSAGSATTMLLKDQDRGWDEYKDGLAQAGAASSMIFFAFITVAVSSLMSIHKLVGRRTKIQQAGEI